MDYTPKISAVQLFIALTVSRVFLCFTNMPQNALLSSTETIIAIAISSVLNFMLFLPFIYISRKIGEKQITNNKLLSAVIVIFCVFLVVETLTQFENFMSSTIYLTSSPIFFLIPMIVVAIFICKLGLEGIARLSGFVLAGIIVAIIMIFIAAFPKMDAVWIDRFLVENYKNLIDVIFKNLCYTTEIAVLFILFPFSKGNIKKCALLFSVLVGVIVESITILNITVLGDYRKSIMFPFYTVAATAKNSMTDRFNAAYIVLFVFVAMIRICIYLFASQKALRKIFYFENNTIVLVLLSVFIFAFSLVSTSEISSISLAQKIIFSGIPTILISIVFPFLLFVLNLIKRRRINEKDRS